MDAKTNLINSSHSTVNKSEIIEGLHTAQYEYSVQYTRHRMAYKLFYSTHGSKKPT